MTEFDQYLPLRDNTGRRKVVIGVFWAFLGINVLFFIVNCTGVMMGINLNDVSDNKEVLFAMIFGIVALLRGVLVIVNIIVFILWFRRAYYNLHRLRAPDLQHAEGWAAGAWFIPILNLAWPYQIMRDIWQKTQLMIKVERPEFTINKSHALISWWWALYLLTNLAENIASRVSEVNLVGAYAFVVLPLSLLAIYTTIEAIKQTGKFEQELYEIHVPLSRDGYVVNVSSLDNTNKPS